MNVACGRRSRPVPTHGFAFANLLSTATGAMLARE
jgi:hypothetical protein